MTPRAGLVQAAPHPPPPVHASAPRRVGVWTVFEARFESATAYDDPLHDLAAFTVRFTAPSGRTHTVDGFWDGGRRWAVRFAPDEPGVWTYGTAASDTGNAGLHGVRGTFRSVPNRSALPLYAHGALAHPPGAYHLAHADGTPFFWAACTAWNGALGATDAEWDAYLADRARKGFSVVQFATTPWRGAAADRAGEAAYTGRDRIRLNVPFFQRLDRKVDALNRHGLVAAPVLLWALQSGPGRDLNPGYTLPEGEAILLARYLVARYGGHHAVWLLGGDGDYTGPFEARWKAIGRGVFGRPHPGVATLHPGGRVWVGDAFAAEPWLDVVGYQSSHATDSGTVRWLTRGPVPSAWARLPARPFINLEPLYEGTPPAGGAALDVRRAAYWSVFAAPVAGVSYGANGLWSFEHRAAVPFNHPRVGVAPPWFEAVRLPGGTQVGYLAGLMRQFAWWRLRPAPALLAEQPGDRAFDRFVSVAAADDGATVLAYLPVPLTVTLRRPGRGPYAVRWFDPATGRYVGPPAAAPESPPGGATLRLTSPLDHDAVLVLARRPAR